MPQTRGVGGAREGQVGRGEASGSEEVDGQGTRTAQPRHPHIHPSAEPHRSPSLTQPNHPGSASNAARSTRPYATMILGYLGTTAIASEAKRLSRMLVDESLGDGPSAFLEMPSRASLIPLPCSPTPTNDDLRPEPVADWSMDEREREVLLSSHIGLSPCRPAGTGCHST
ncbi:hypothetical protein OF846_003648 [Rhodotorula toruloides]|nr:hypothetical protein OF846_003648 [Rhodotorula toruloides]